jgi:hypothetical protein
LSDRHLVRDRRSSAGVSSGRAALLTAASLLLLLLLAACSGLLGIEERRLAGADDYPVGGYEGCRPGQSCSGCILPSHREQCDAPDDPSLCEANGLGSCARCACDGGCQAAIAECQDTPGCPAVWSCINEHRCELLESSPQSCHRAVTCQGPISNNGGIGGEALRKAAAIRACSAGASCYTCLPPEPEPPAECTPAAGCQGCNN